ncbi:hypothetical protein B9Z55_004985 [Caenorhabditis nigoni]|uniref:Uncharacterized protein n=1 Tax=Caenorhabditis nigoni TaxID=1611254 RepID=A0A2G5UYZ7_9PELO|nr:hypothetical protein B9Z55_004985 [Caenorhabditis nigoni]
MLFNPIFYVAVVFGQVLGEWGANGLIGVLHRLSNQKIYTVEAANVGEKALDWGIEDSLPLDAILREKVAKLCLWLTSTTIEEIAKVSIVNPQSYPMVSRIMTWSRVPYK